MYQAQTNIYPQVIWNTYTKLVQSANLTIEAIDPATDNKQNRYYLGAAYAYRSQAYLDMARMFEYLPCDATKPESPEGNSVLGLTVPIVKENMTEEEARINPRATHEEMMAFLIESLDKAEELITAEARPNKTMPDLACVYGLKARAYMWDEDYAKAAEYAKLAYTTHGAAPLTRDEWLSTTDGFNNLNTPAWMWGMQFVKEDDAVQTAIINWTSWASNEFVQGYSYIEPNVCIDAKLYDQISDNDFRKLSFVAPAGGALSGREVYINKAALAPVTLAPYASLKVRPGQGEMTEYTIACAVAVPLMRVEEMYLIEAEAKAHISASEGKSLIESFMKNYRDSQYVCAANTSEAVVDEIFLQKRIEFFEEGLILFDYKRLNKPVTRFYEGTNWTEAAQFNTTTRPAWMNYVIVMTEGNNNAGVREYNNPDPSQCYAPAGKK